MPSSESIGALLVRLRGIRGVSQLRLAELLCAASGLSTITRHEVSRWEREERVPGALWLRWLAVVLDVPLREMEAAAATGRSRRSARSTDRLLWTPHTAMALADLLTRGDERDLARLAHAWLTVPAGPPDREPPEPARDELSPARIRDLRRMDDLVSGPELAGVVDRELRAALARLRDDRPERRPLCHVAELAQLAGWTAADAGRPRAAARAYRVGLDAATAADDRALGAHVLGCLSHLRATADPAEALLLARSGLAGARQSSPAGVQALLQHRVALAAALAGERRASEEALVAAERLADRRDPARDPSWLYWLDEGELAALSGRTFTALRRPLRAEPLLRRRLDRPPHDAAPHDAAPHDAAPHDAAPHGATAAGDHRTAHGAAAVGDHRTAHGAAAVGGHRTAAIDGGWLAEAYLDAGEVEQACEVASVALLAAVRSGSPRATARALALRTRLTGTCPATERYVELVTAARPYLPGPIPGSTVRRISR